MLQITKTNNLLNVIQLLLNRETVTDNNRLLPLNMNSIHPLPIQFYNKPLCSKILSVKYHIGENWDKNFKRCGCCKYGHINLLCQLKMNN